MDRKSPDEILKLVQRGFKNLVKLYCDDIIAPYYGRYPVQYTRNKFPGFVEALDKLDPALDCFKRFLRLDYYNQETYENVLKVLAAHQRFYQEGIDVATVHQFDRSFIDQYSAGFKGYEKMGRSDLVRERIGYGGHNVSRECRNTFAEHYDETIGSLIMELDIAYLESGWKNRY
jgi:hypothetical protein